MYFFYSELSELFEAWFLSDPGTHPKNKVNCRSLGTFRVDSAGQAFAFDADVGV
jgi:hypothetical protein